MSEADMVGKVQSLMESLDEVKRYRELAHGLVDFAATFVLSVIVAVLLVVALGLNAVFSGYPTSGDIMFFGSYLPAGGWGVVPFFVVIAGFLGGVVQIGRRVDQTKTGEWKSTLSEGAPGAVKLLEDTDWESTLGIVSLARLSFALYTTVKVIGYTLGFVFLLGLIDMIGGGLVAYPFNPAAVIVVSIVLALVLNRKNTEKALKRLRSLDLLFWDLRWFYSEFKRAEFNKA